MNNKEKFLEIYRACIQREGSEAFLNYLLEKTDFFTAPASTRFHGAYEGGLLRHSLNVYECLKAYAERERARRRQRIQGRFRTMRVRRVRDFRFAQLPVAVHVRHVLDEPERTDERNILS